VKTVLLVPDLASERWPSMDRYASRLATLLPAAAPGFAFELATPIASLTSDAGGALDVPDTGADAPGELRRYFDRYVRYPLRVARHAPDLVHVLDHSYAHIVKTHRGRTLVTVHDLLPVIAVRRRATSVRERVRNTLLHRVLRGLRRAKAWIVATEWLRTELSEWLGHDDAIHVVPYGVDEAFFFPTDESRRDTRDRLGLPGDAYVVLHVGSTVERKNVPAVMAGVAGLRARGVPAWLLQIGGRFTHRQLADLDASALGACTVQRPEAPERELRAAYRAADVLLFPSHYEGFGLPLLEAMASGLPIVTSGAAALAEVAGDAAVVVASRDPERFVDALARLAGDPVAAGALSAKGRERARRFTWAETARRTAEVYRGLV
jgi:glycosyltransferase involved in cell wall biosynthesis